LTQWSHSSGFTLCLGGLGLLNLNPESLKCGYGCWPNLNPIYTILLGFCSCYSQFGVRFLDRGGYWALHLKV
jgi:hypothetical protein